MISAGCTACTTASIAKSGSCTSGSPVGTLPMTGVSVSHRTPSSVPANQSAQCSGQELAELPRPDDAHDKGDQGDGECAEVYIAYRPRQGTNCSHRPSRCDGRTQERQRLQQDDDYPDARHEPGYHRVGSEGDEPADPKHAEKDLYDPRQDDYRKRPGQVVGVGGDDDRHDHCHGAGGAGYLGARPSEYRREEADCDRPVDSGECAEARGHAKRKGYREAHYCRRDASEDVPSEGLEVVGQAGDKTT